MKMMPLEVMMPTTGQLTLTLPASGAAEKSHNPFGSLISIAGIKDEVVVMPSLQRPKKVQLQSRWLLWHNSYASMTGHILLLSKAVAGASELLYR